MTLAAITNAITVLNTTGRPAGILSRAPALNVAAQGTATAALSQDNAASTPPAALIKDRPPYITHGLWRGSSPTSHPAGGSPSGNAGGGARGPGDRAGGGQPGRDREGGAGGVVGGWPGAGDRNRDQHRHEADGPDRV